MPTTPEATSKKLAGSGVGVIGGTTGVVPPPPPVPPPPLPPPGPPQIGGKSGGKTSVLLEVSGGTIGGVSKPTGGIRSERVTCVVSIGGALISISGGNVTVSMGGKKRSRVPGVGGGTSQANSSFSQRLLACHHVLRPLYLRVWLPVGMADAPLRPRLCGGFTHLIANRNHYLGLDEALACRRSHRRDHAAARACGQEQNKSDTAHPNMAPRTLHSYLLLLGQLLQTEPYVPSPC